MPMQILGKTNFDFMGKRPLFAVLTIAALVFSIGALSVRGIRRSVEFTGGAGVVLRYAAAPSLEQVRDTLARAGFTGVTVTTFGGTEGKELSIRVGLGEAKAGNEDPGRDLAQRVVDALTPGEVKEKRQGGMIDLNHADRVALARQLQEANVPEADAQRAAAAIAELRAGNGGVLESVESALALPAVSPEARAFLQGKAFTGPFGLRGQEMIDGAVTSEMQSKALFASLGALGGMLLYLWLRFKLRFGVGAVVALAFDVVFTLGLFAAMGYEFSLPVVAAFLTLIGYSANDKVVIFDRIREMMKTRGEARLRDLINDAVNDVLSRTIVTGICTIFCAASLYFFGGSVLEGFAFVLLAGIVVGTLSSIVVACPVVLLWHDVVVRRTATAAAKHGAKAQHHKHA